MVGERLSSSGTRLDATGSPVASVAPTKGSQESVHRLKSISKQSLLGTNQYLLLGRSAPSVISFCVYYTLYRKRGVIKGYSFFYLLPRLLKFSSVLRMYLY